MREIVRNWIPRKIFKQMSDRGKKIFSLDSIPLAAFFPSPLIVQSRNGGMTFPVDFMGSRQLVWCRHSDYSSPLILCPCKDSIRVRPFSLRLSQFISRASTWKACVCRLNSKPKNENCQICVVKLFLCHRKRSSEASMLMQFLNTLLWRLSGWRTIGFVYVSTYDHTKAQQWNWQQMRKWLSLPFFARRQFNQQPTEVHRLMGTFRPLVLWLFNIPRTLRIRVIMFHIKIDPIFRCDSKRKILRFFFVAHKFVIFTTALKAMINFSTVFS